MSNSPLPVHRILIVQTAFIGDVILTLPLLQEAKRSFPDSEIDFIAIPAARTLLETHDDLNELIIYDKRNTDRGISNYMSLAKKLRKKRYNLALVPHRSLRSAVLVRLAACKRSISFDRSAGRMLFTDTVSYPRSSVHEIDRNLKLLSPLNIEINNKVFPLLYFNDEDEQVVNRWLDKNEISPGESTVTIAPGSVWNTKRWLPERFAGVATALIERGVKVILIGGPADEQLGSEIAAAVNGKIHNAIGKCSLRQSALLIKHSRVLLTNDSAPMHLAVSVGTPVTAVFGPTITDFGFFPYGDNDVVVETDGLVCRPCGSHGGNTCPIKTFDCMKSITIDPVLAEVQSMLNSKNKSEEP
ncbi:MAG: lipopolysaccharide heptosyltransferase II [Calditrichia bacterium]